MKAKCGGGLRSSRFLSFVLFVSCVHLVDKARCEVYRSLQWTPDNPVFMPGCGDGVPRMNVLPSSKIFVICPTPVTVLETVQSTKAKQNLFENLWIIYDKESFETCNVNMSNSQLLKKKNRQLMQCDKPLELKYFPIVFQQFSAVPGGLEFTPGYEYYFLATSDGTQGSLNDASGGHCNDTENGVSMKFKVYVCIGESDPQCTQSAAELGTFYCEKPGPTSSTIAPALTPSSTVLTSVLKPAATSKMLGEGTPKKSTVASSSPESWCVCPSVTKVDDRTTYSSVSSTSPSQSSVQTQNCDMTTIYPTITHTVMANQTLCESNSAPDKSTVSPSNSNTGCCSTVTSVVNHSAHVSVKSTSPSAVTASVKSTSPSAVTPSSFEHGNVSTTGTKSVNRPAHTSANSILLLSPQLSVQTPNSLPNNSTVYPTITLIQFIYCTVCNGSNSVTPSPFATSGTMASDVVSSVVVPSKNPCPKCEEFGKNAAQQASGSSENKGTWMPVGIFFICFCVILVLAFGIYTKFFQKRTKRVASRVSSESA